MQVAIYSSPWSAVIRPTGVGRHIVETSAGMASSPGIDARLVATRRDYERVRPHLAPSLASLEVCHLPPMERLGRLLMLSTKLAPLERFCGDVDWVYCPKEQPVATRRARLAVTVHDLAHLETGVDGLNAADRKTRLRWKAILARVVERADLILTISQFTRRRILELLDVEPRAPIAIVGCGVSDVFYRTPNERDVEVLRKYGLQDQPFMTTGGTLTNRKNGSMVLKLGTRLRQAGHGVTILVPGRRHDEALLQEHQRLFAADARPAVRLLGYVSDEDLAILHSHARAMLFPSIYEGFGIPVLEAMAAGTAVLASNTTAVPESGGDAATLLSPHDEGAWFAAIERIVDDSAFRAGQITKGRSRAAEYTWRHCTQRIVAAMAN